MYRYSGAIRAPTAASRARNCSCCATAAADHARISASGRCPPPAAPAPRVRAAEEHDVALRRRDGGAHAEHALPARLVDGLRRLLLRARSATPSARATTARSRSASGASERRIGIERHGSEGTEAARRTARTKRSSRRCPCTARAARTRRREARRGAPSSRRRRRRRRCARGRSTSAASRSRPTSARTIARWYDAARSALRALDVVLAPRSAHGVEQRGLQPGEREVEAGHARDREGERVGSPSRASRSIAAPPG